LEALSIKVDHLFQLNQTKTLQMQVKVNNQEKTGKVARSKLSSYLFRYQQKTTVRQEEKSNNKKTKRLQLKILYNCHQLRLLRLNK